MYRLGLSIAHTDRAVVLIKNQEPIKILCEKMDEDVDPKDDPLGLIKGLLDTQRLKISDLESVSIAAPWRSPEHESEAGSSWLLPLKNLGRRIHQDWTFKGETKEKIVEYFGEQIPLHFLSEDQCRSAFSLRRFSQQNSFILNLHSRPEEMGTTLWRVGNQGMEPLIAFEQDESMEFLLSNLALYCGFSGPQAIRSFLSLSHMGEESLLDKLYGIVNLDADGRLDIDLSQLEERPSQNSEFESLVELFGPVRNAETPVSVRELDLAASAKALLHAQIIRLSNTMLKEQGEIPLVIQSESFFGDFLRSEFENLNLFRNVTWLREKESVAEALGAVYAGMGESLNWQFEPDHWQPLSYTQIFKDGLSHEA